MGKFRMIKLENLFAEYQTAIDYTSYKEDLKNKTRLSPTQVWKKIVKEIKEQTKRGNPYAKKMLNALDKKGEPRGGEWLNNRDEYLQEIFG